MAITYQPPGVSVQELTSPSVNPVVSDNTTICLVGLTQGFETKTFQLTFPTGTTPKTYTVPAGGIFLKVGTTQAFVSAIDAVDPTKGTGNIATGVGGYVEGAAADFTTSLSADSKTITITPVAASDIATLGAVINFTYEYLADNYFEPTTLDSLSSVQARFGNAYSTDGLTINSAVSFAAGMAFENGAANLIIQPLFELSTPGDHSSTKLQATTGDVATASVWADTLYNLRDNTDINLIVPVIGQSFSGVGDSTLQDIHKVVQDHQQFMLSQGQYIFAYLGEDATTSTTNGSMATLRTHADELAARYGGALAEATVKVTPSLFYKTLPVDNSKTLAIGGQYIAAALAGMTAARPITATLTRKQISGVATVGQTRTKADKDTDASHGLTVIEAKGSAVQVRHAITLDATSTAKRELSVVRAKHNVIESVRTTIDAALPIVADGNAATVVKLLAIGVLEQLRLRREIVAYAGVEARILDSDPTTAEVRFSYRPAYPLNYVEIVFSLDLTNGEAA
jgi:hypothetical protein